MAFRSIHELAGTVLQEAALRAARQATAANEGGDGPMSQGEGEPLDPSPRLNASGESASNSGMGKKAGTPFGETFRPVNGGGQTTGETVKGRSGLTNGHRMAPALPMSRERYVATQPPRGRRPNGPAAYLSLVVDNTHASTDFLRGTL